MPRLKILVAYVGTNYCGWQIQNTLSRRPQPTIQEELERIVERVTGSPIRVFGSGRTDSGVHADGQVAHFDIPEAKLDMDWQRTFNSMLPDDIAVLSVEQVADDFHSRKDAKGKAYSYSLWLSKRYTPPRLFPFVWATGPLDVAAMDVAAAHLVGTHDFSSFQNVGTDIETTVRTILGITRTPLGTVPMEDTPMQLTWRFEADGFLKQMVRNLMGTLVACGTGKLSPDDVPALLTACDRTKAPCTAPAQGLSLTQVYY